MLILMMGLLKKESAAEVSRLQPELNGHLAQPFLRIRAAGPLRGQSGDEAGFMILIEAPSLEEATGYFETDPLLRDGLYEQLHVMEFADEVGTL